MGMVCTTCTHEEHKAIDKALAEGKPTLRIAAKYGIPESTLRLHKRNHLPKRLARAAEKADLADATLTFQTARKLMNESLEILHECKTTGRFDTAVRAITACARATELMARLEGEIEGGGTVVNVLVNPQWVSIRQVVIESLRPFPQAAAAVGVALSQLEESKENFDQAPKTPGQGPAISPVLPEQEPK